jgi:hypothetical protein
MVPAPPTGNKIYFLRYPLAMMLGPEGFSTDGCTGYLMGQLPKDLIAVVTVHKVATYFNNNLVTPASVMKDYQTRYLSETFAAFPSGPRISVNTDDAVYTSSGSWVTVWLPAEPRLTPSQLAQVRAVAQAQHFNIVQIPPRPTLPIARLVPWPAVIIRNKAVSSTFPYSLLNVPCWAQNHDYLTYQTQTSPAFFAKYGSNPSNMGPYWVGGVKLTFAQFISKYSKQ